MNKFTIEGNVAELDVSGKKVLIDAEDLNKVLGKRWYWSVVKGKVITADSEYLHRVVLDVVSQTFTVKAVNGNYFDCRKDNLLVKVKENPKAKGIKGVSNRGGKFIAQIRKEGKTKHLGVFSTELEAARAYNKAAREIHGKLATLNPETKLGYMWQKVKERYTGARG